MCVYSSKKAANSQGNWVKLEVVSMIIFNILELQKESYKEYWELNQKESRVILVKPKVSKKVSPSMETCKEQVLGSFLDFEESDKVHKSALSNYKDSKILFKKAKQDAVVQQRDYEPRKAALLKSRNSDFTVLV